MVKPISPYLQRPLRSLEQAMRDLDADRERERRAKAAPADGAAKAATPKDTVSIAGQDVAIPPSEPAAPTTGTQLDLKA
jgi:hypothetical protein